MPNISITTDLVEFATSPFARWASLEPWALTASLAPRIEALIAELRPDDHVISDNVAVHRSATVQSGVVLKGPVIVGARAMLAHGCTVRGGNWIGAGCTIGPGVELKASIVFSGTRLAHFNFVGDSILGADVNLEAGSIICNHRNERPDSTVRVLRDGRLVDTGVSKFGAVVGDGARIGANAVLAPGTLLPRAFVVGRLQLVDPEAAA